MSTPQPKNERITKYRDIVSGDGFKGPLYIAITADVLILAHKEGVTRLIVTEKEFETIKKFMLCNGAWNWDMETIWGMKITISE